MKQFHTSVMEIVNRLWKFKIALYYAQLDTRCLLKINKVLGNALIWLF